MSLSAKKRWSSEQEREKAKDKSKKLWQDEKFVNKLKKSYIIHKDERLKASLKGAETWKGQHHSEETKERIRDSMKNHFAKKLIQEAKNEK